MQLSSQPTPSGPQRRRGSSSLSASQLFHPLCIIHDEQLTTTCFHGRTAETTETAAAVSSLLTRFPGQSRWRTRGIFLVPTNHAGQPAE
eukprot:1179393-Prorocentrum_minimum.AAC.2